MNMTKIDLENHFYADCLIEALAERTEPPRITKDRSVIWWTDFIDMQQGRLLDILLDLAEERKQAMERNGITCAVLSSSAGPEQLDTAKSIEVCRGTNDVLYEVTKKYPGQYLGSAILPVNDVDAACAELERCVKDLGFVSWQTHSNYGAHSADEEQYRPIFQKAADLGVYVYLHPQIPNEGRLNNLGFTVAGAGLGFTENTIETLVRLVISGIFDEIPNLKLVLGHLGEAIPFLLERMDNRLFFIPNPNIKCEHTLRYYFEHNIMVTTSGNMSPEAFECTKSVLGIDKICFGSDYPYENVDEMSAFVDGLPLSEEERELVNYKNAVEQLGIKL